MPATSIRDLVVHDEDLVVGTHGLGRGDARNPGQRQRAGAAIIERRQAPVAGPHALRGGRLAPAISAPFEGSGNASFHLGSARCAAPRRRRRPRRSSHLGDLPGHPGGSRGMDAARHLHREADGGWPQLYAAAGGEARSARGALRYAPAGLPAGLDKLTSPQPTVEISKFNQASFGDDAVG